MRKLLFLMVLVLVSCQENKVAHESIIENENVLILSDTIVLENKQDKLSNTIDSLFRLNHLVDIQTLNHSIKIDVRYATENNFMGIQLYDSISKIYLNEEVALRLSKCQNYLDSIRPGYSLLVYDGVRPLQVQREMWEALDSIPTYRRGKFVSNPARGSVHNYGAAVDLTIVDSLGNILDMGAGYDDPRQIAYPSLEGQFLKSGELTKNQWENRKLLRKVMRMEGFRNIPTEWWHFNASSRVTSSRKYKRILNESGGADWNILAYPKKDSLTY